MGRFWKIIITVCLLTNLTQMAQAAEDHQAQPDSVLVQMFTWFNEAFMQEEKFTEEDFARYFTDDIVFVLNGKRSPKGLKSLTERFNMLKENYHVIEIMLPMKEEFTSGDKIFTYHLNRGQTLKDGPMSGFSHVMGFVVIKEGKIDLLNFLDYTAPEKTAGP